MKYKISVIIPFYNVEKYIKECLDSIVNQTIGIDNIEVILVDDCSPDNSIAIVNEYLAKYPSFKLIMNKTNQGLGESRNIALKQVSSDYVTFLDSDDVISADLYEKSILKLEESNVDLLIYNWETYGAKESSIHNQNTEKDVTIENLNDCPQLVFSTPAWNKIYHKSLFKYLKYPKGYYEDNVVTMEVLINANKILRSKDGLYYYRKNEESITNDISIKNPLELSKVIKNLFNLKNKYPEYFHSIKLLAINFTNDILIWLYSYKWYIPEEIEILDNLKSAIGEITEDDLNYFNRLFTDKELYREILDLNTLDAETFLAKYKYFNRNPLRNLQAKLYLDTGSGFNENETIEIYYELNRVNYIKFNLDAFENIKKLRFDPVGSQFVKVKLLSIDSNVNSFKIATANCKNSLYEEYQFFINLDPYYVIEGDFKEISYINFEFKLDILTDNEVKRLFMDK